MSCIGEISFIDCMSSIGYKFCIGCMDCKSSIDGMSFISCKSCIGSMLYIDCELYIANPIYILFSYLQFLMNGDDGFPYLRAQLILNNYFGLNLQCLYNAFFSRNFSISNSTILLKLFVSIRHRYFVYEGFLKTVQ